MKTVEVTPKQAERLIATGFVRINLRIALPDGQVRRGEAWMRMFHPPRKIASPREKGRS